MVPRRRNTAKPPPPECPLEECMRLLRGTWTVQIIWYLRGVVRRFGELRFDMPRISAKTLSARLQRLERDGIVTREVKPTSPPTVDYALTPLGERLLPAIEGIVEVGREIKQARVNRSRSLAASELSPRRPALRESRRALVAPAPLPRKKPK
jgi:DNA-binding HxlR family transcriptional regulator